MRMRSDLVIAFRSVDSPVEGDDDVDLPFLLVQHDPAQCSGTDRPRVTNVQQCTFQKAMALHNNLFAMVNIRLYASSLERAIKVVKVSAQKAAQGAPRARTVAAHQAIAHK